MKPYLIFDLDDTLCGVELDGKLVPGYEAYNDTIRRFGYAMQLLGFDGEGAIETHKQIDEDMCRAVGFGDKTRFAQSMVETYKRLAGHDAVRCNEDLMYRIGMSVFTDYPYLPLEGATHVLSTYHWYYNIVVVTKGQEDEQHKKLNDTGLIQWVDRVVVCDRKDDKEWLDVLDTIGLYEWKPALKGASWAIGNSAKADVNPPLKYGLNALHISDPNGWVFENAEYEEPWLSRRLATIKGVNECFNYIPVLG